MQKCQRVTRNYFFAACELQERRWYGIVEPMVRTHMSDGRNEPAGKR
jgi:hypothetical protein